MPETLHVASKPSCLYKEATIDLTERIICLKWIWDLFPCSLQIYRRLHAMTWFKATIISLSIDASSAMRRRSRDTYMSADKHNRDIVDET